MKRRTLLKAGLGFGLIGPLMPGLALGAYPTEAFLAKDDA